MSFIPLSTCCLQGGRLTGTPRGTFTASNNTQRVGRYQTKPSEGKVVDEKVALVLYTDAFGLELSNPKIMADAFADQLKINVYVPEYIINPPPVDVFEPVAPLYPDQYASRSWATTIYMIIEVIWKIWRWLPMLLFPKKQVPLAQAAINDLTSEGYEKIVAVGYCRGGAMVQYLLSNQANTTLVGGIICHPSPEKSTWPQITKPSVWHLADHDQMFGAKDIQLLKDSFQKKVEDENVDFDCIVHTDTVHGFAARPTLEHEATKKAFNEANKSVVGFCENYLLGSD
ncbi:uncharacterized protein I206_107536 [Kwoniella pini CBS 10737]|uniref:Dienelactone hydrolase domain-containing protein n=1 Tax=Kwoniella pini CBS 10737 TaxID=1296096 RepID=A0A1B9HXM4_9TREE|nr:uncharacterized protein I206_05864 [Kwoniella pini CBS 10737]OCF47998.1 hypothetical protein I206_05864 [Kwoniella pini CBS 10737]